MDHCVGIVISRCPPVVKAGDIVLSTSVHKSVCVCVCNVTTLQHCGEGIGAVQALLINNNDNTTIYKVP